MVFKKIWNFLSFWYFQYTLNTSLYMMEPIERRAFNFTMGLLDELVKRLKHYYRIYAVNSSVYMLEPAEEIVVNTVLVAVIAMVLYTSYLFLPGHALMIVHFLTRLLGGSTDEDVIAGTTHVDMSS